MSGPVLGARGTKGQLLRTGRIYRVINNFLSPRGGMVSKEVMGVEFRGLI